MRRCYVKGLLGEVFLVGFCLSLTGSVFADVSVSPAYVDVRLDKGRISDKFEIINQGQTEERYRVKSLHFTFSRLGGLDRLAPDANSLASWIIFNPTEFVIAPGTRQTVRFTITPPRGRLHQGEYWAGMELESLNVQTTSAKDGGGREMKITVISTVLVPIFGQVGEVTHEAELKEALLTWKDRMPAAQAVVVNKGTGRLLVSGKYEVINEAGTSIATGGLARAYVLPGSEQQFTASLDGPIPAGKYTVRVTCAAPQVKDPLQSETQVDWNAIPPPEEPAPAAPAVGAAAAAPDQPAAK